MSRPLKEFAIVHYVANGPARGCGSEIVEELDFVWAATPDQAVDAYCMAAGVHRRSSESTAVGVYNDWYEAEEVDDGTEA